MDFSVLCWLNTFLCKKWQSLNISCTMTLRRALFSILLNGLCWNSYFISWSHLSLPPKESELQQRQRWTKWFYSSVCWKEIWRKWGKTQTSACSHWHLQYSCPSLHQWQTGSPGKGRDGILAIQLDLCFQEKRRKKHLLDERRPRQGINGQFSNWWNGDQQSHKETKSKNFTFFLPMSDFAASSIQHGAPCQGILYI